MSTASNVLIERGLVRVIARHLQAPPVTGTHDCVYDVEIGGEEVLKTFSSLEEAEQFLDMLEPSS